ncbi:MAG TPA: hypothetical protein PLQ32_05960 [Flavihumibacter sp.]|nr:hypothetical protein [Bacteroidota bacterium]HPZ87626.1 hypothetical protein [Flavihumibacter sp.]HQD09773.1 hypothetical protein [Flavihumibacter sp.]
MRPFVSLLLLTVLTIGSCQKSNDTSLVEIRVTNNTRTTITHLAINPSSIFGSDSSSPIGHIYGTVAAGASTDYKPYKSAYRFAEYSLEIDGKKYSAVPYDYVGEKLLAPGRYSYQLSLDANTGHLNLTCVSD